MVKLKRQELGAEARRRNQEQLATVGGQIRAARQRRRLTQAQLGSRVGLARATVGSLERGAGGGHTVDTWHRLALALDLNLRIEMQRDYLEEPADAGHLPMQELLLRLARRQGVGRTFELPIRASLSRHSVDVFLRDDRRRRLTVVECANVVADIGAMARNFDWKLARAAETAVAIGRGEPYAVGGCLVMRATAPQSRTRRSICGCLRESLAREFTSMGERADKRRQSARRTGSRVVRYRWDASVRVATSLARH